MVTIGNGTQEEKITWVNLILLHVNRQKMQTQVHESKVVPGGLQCILYLNANKMKRWDYKC
jgi:hypothetical protein